METSEKKLPSLMSWVKRARSILETLPRPRKIFIASDNNEVIKKFVAYFGKETVSDISVFASMLLTLLGTEYIFSYHTLVSVKFKSRNKKCMVHCMINKLLRAQKERCFSSGSLMISLEEEKVAAAVITSSETRASKGMGREGRDAVIRITKTLIKRRHK